MIHYSDLAARERALEHHRAYLAKGREAGFVVESGPFVDGRGGMYVLQVSDEAMARAFVDADPYVKEAHLHVVMRAFKSALEKM